jgi:hypothetical protein
MNALMWIVCVLLVLSIFAHVAMIQVLIVAVGRIMKLEIAVASAREIERQAK